MSNIEDLRSMVEIRQKELGEAKENLWQVKQALAEAVCPFKVGQEILIPKGFGKKAVIDKITPGDRFWGVWSVTVTPIKVNGESGVQKKIYPCYNRGLLELNGVKENG